MDKLLDFLKTTLDILSTRYRHIGDRGGYTTADGEVFKDMRQDFKGDGEITPDSIGDLRNELRKIKSQHVFLKK